MLSHRLLLLAPLLAAPIPLPAQNDRWYPTAADTQAQALSTTPSPLRTWQVVLPLRRGVELWAHNPTSEPVRIPIVEVWDCVNIDGGCGRIPLDTLVAPGDSLVLSTLHPRQWNAKYRFRWTHYWAPLGLAPEPTPPYVLPAWAVPPLQAAAFLEYYEEAAFLAPRTLEPDLDGDGRADLVIPIQDHGGHRGLAVLVQGAPNPIILGAGQRFGPLGLDFADLLGWELAAYGVAGRQSVRLRFKDGVSGDLVCTTSGCTWWAN